MEKRTFTNEGVQVKYLDMGRGKPIVWLHGAMVGANTYKEIYSLLTQKYRVLAPDLPGFGESSVPNRNWKLRDYANIIKGLIEENSLTDVTVAGHSFGGGVAAYLPEICPSVKRLVLVDAAGILGRISWQHYFIAAIRKTIYGLKHNKDVTAWITKNSYKDWWGKHFLEIPTMVRILTQNLSHQVKILPDIKIPCLVLWGLEDEFIPLKYGEEISKIYRSAVFLSIDGNHDWCLFDPQLFIDKVEDFLDSTSRNTSKAHESSDR